MNTNRSIQKVLAVTAAAAMCVSLSGCKSKPKEILECINNGNYDAALLIYNDWEINEKGYEKLCELLKQKLVDLVSDYANNNIDYDTAIQTMSTISTMNLSELVEPLAVASADVAGLYHSKEMYVSGESAFDSEDYVAALSRLLQVIETDCNYASAAELIESSKTKVFEKSRALADEHYYDEAIALLSDASQYIEDQSKVNEQIEILQSEKEEYLYQQTKKQALELSASYAKDNNYEDALIIINDLKYEYQREDEEVESIYAEYADKYVEFILVKADALRAEKNYIKALEMLKNAKNIVPSEKFDELQKVIEAEKPLYLCEIKNQTSDRFEEVIEGEPLTDTLGNTYPLGNLFSMSSCESGWSNYNGFVDYYLGYKYEKLHGVIAVDDRSADISSTFTIEGDGEVIFSLELNRLTVPTVIDLDVTNYNYLSFKMGDVSDEGTIYAILSDFYFYQ